MSVERSRPEDFLALVERAKRGRLKVYIGPAAGVGKTYQMLEEAHTLKKRGVDVVLAFVETHGRSETEALVEGLEGTPRRRFEYRGVNTEEMDLDAVLARRPQVAIVDELPHTNIPGCRNKKRYQDVLELLDAGQFTLEGPITFEGFPIDHLHSVKFSRAIPRQPHFSVTAAADAAQQFVTRDGRRIGRGWSRLSHVISD